MNRRAVDALMVTYYSPSHPRGNMFRKISLIWEIPVKGDALPSDIFHSNCFLGFQEDALGIRLRDVIGVDTLMWGRTIPMETPHSPGAARFSSIF